MQQTVSILSVRARPEAVVVVIDTRKHCRERGAKSRRAAGGPGEDGEDNCWKLVISESTVKVRLLDFYEVPSARA